MNAVIVITLVGSSPVSPILPTTVLPNTVVTELTTRPGLQLFSFNADDIGYALRVLEHLRLRDEVESAYVFVGCSGFHVRGENAGWIAPYPK